MTVRHCFGCWDELRGVKRHTVHGVGELGADGLGLYVPDSRIYADTTDEEVRSEEGRLERPDRIYTAKVTGSSSA